MTMLPALPPSRVTAVAAATARAMKVRRSYVLGRTRRANIAAARFAMVWVLREATRSSFAQIGEQLRRDHSTIVHAFHRAEQLRIADPEFRAITDRLLSAERERTAR